MAGQASGRTVMVREWYEVPAIPDADVRAAFGGQFVLDPRVELVELTVEYWARDGIPRDVAAERILEAMQGRITADNIYFLVRLLSERGYAQKFFALTSRSADHHGELRRYLLSHGLLLDTIRYYDAWSGLDPKLFFDGFVVGIGESFASALFDLAQLVKLIFEVQQKVLILGIQVSAGDVSGLQDSWAVVVQAGKAILSQFDLRQLPAKILEYWRDFNAKFAAHLENLEPYEAGHQLGRLAGDLWQLLSGVEAFAKMVKLGAGLAMRFAPLVVSSVRTVAVEAAAAIKSLVELLLKLGKQAVEALPRVGLSLLRTLITDKGMKLLADGRAAVAEALNVTLLPPMAFEGAFAVPSDMRMAAMVGQKDFSMMASVPHSVPPTRPPLTGADFGMPGINVRDPGTRPADFDKVLDDIIAQLDQLGPVEKADASALDAAAVSTAAKDLLEARLTTQLRELLLDTTRQLFIETEGKVEPWVLGTKSHTRIAPAARALVQQASPGLIARTEESLAKTATELAKTDATVAARFKKTGNAAKGVAERALDSTIGQMLLADRDADRLLDLIGVDTKPAARTQKAVEKYLADTFKWKRDTKVGALEHDLLIIDPAKGGSGSMINVDFTPGTKLREFKELSAQAYKDLGADPKLFNGDWSKLAEAYAKANKTMPPEMISKLRALQVHALRETVIRRAALIAVFGDLWNIRSYEMLYESMNLLFKAKII